MGADVRTSGRVWRAVDTHFEAYPGFGTQLHDYTADQAEELLAALSEQPRTVVLGDLNSRPDNPLAQGYSVLLDNGFSPREVQRMVRDNPAQLLGVPSAAAVG